MKKIRLLLLLSIFTMILSSNVIAQEQYSSEWDKYDAYSFESSKSRLSSNPEELEVYNQIYDGFMNLSDSIYLPNGDMSINQVFDIMQKVLYDHTEIFYVKTAITYRTDGKVDFTYVYPKDNIEKMKNDLENKVNSIINEITKPSMSEFEKELAIHDYIVLNTRYDEENYKNNTIPVDSYNTYGTLIKGVAVCQGYAETFKLLLNKVGIDSIIVSSRPMNHAWNIVNIDGENYQVDVTWNDPTPDRKGKTSYKHLNLTDEQMKKNHNWDYWKYPTSTDDKYSMYWNIDSPITHQNKTYYSGTEKNKEFIYTLDENLEIKQITNVRAPFFDIAGEDIYFSNYSNGGYLYKIKTDGTGLTKQINNTHSIDIYSEGDYLYYTEKDSGSKKKIQVDISTAETKVKSIDLDKMKLTLQEGKIDKLVETIYPSNSTNKKVTWTSSNPSVATVDQAGNVKAISQGQTDITVTTIDGEKTATSNVLVERDYSEYTKLESASTNELDKTWTINFNKDVDINSINKDTIYILDENRNKIELRYETIGKQVKLTPKQNFINKKYIIVVTKSVKSDGKQLNVPIIKEFNIK